MLEAVFSAEVGYAERMGFRDKCGVKWRRWFGPREKEEVELD
jgi:hypothetical protein